MAEMTGSDGTIRADYLTRFNSGYQPHSAGRVKGWMKRRRGKDLVRLILEQDYQANEEIRAEAARLFGVEPQEITNEAMMIFCQVHNAIVTKDTTAFSNLMDRAYGKPKEDIQVRTGNNPQFIVEIASNDGNNYPPIATSEDEIGPAGSIDQKLP